MSASGKSTISKPLACELGAIRIRSDVERKRLHELDATAPARSSPNTGLYTTKSSDATYAHLLALADTVLAAGYTVIIDAVFLELHQRQLFQTLAEKQGYQFIILEFTAKANTLRQRIKKRTKGVSDAGAEVLEYQLKHWQPLEEAEAPYQCWVNTEENVDVKRLAKILNKKVLDQYELTTRNREDKCY